VNQAYFALGIPAFPVAHANRHELHVLNMLLGGGISSRLFRRIRDEHGLVYDIGSEYQAYRDNGLLVVEGSTAPQHLVKVLELTLDALRSLADWSEAVDDEELWKAKMQIRGQHSIGGESTHTRMSRLATQELYFGRYLPRDEVLGQIEAVDAASLKRFSNGWLREALAAMSLAVVGPEAPQFYDRARLADVLASRAQRAGIGAASTDT
jgi:predicted Zn-dependent peptidase